MGEDIGEKLPEIGFVGHFQGFHPVVQPPAGNQFQDAHRIIVVIGEGHALHEPGIAMHEGQNTGFLARAAGAGDGHVPDGHGKGLVKHEF